MKLTTAQCKAFSKIASPKNKKEALQGVFFDDVSNLCACDGFMFARFYCVSAPGLDHLPRVKKDPLHDHLTGILNAAASGDGAFAASGKKANYHGDGPTLCAKNLRAFARWSANQYELDAMPLGNAFVSASKLAGMLEVFPDALIYVSSAVDPVYFKSENGDGILLPVRVRDPKSACTRLEEYKASVAAPVSDHVQPSDPSADFVPVSIRDAVENTPETPVKVISYKSDGNTVCIRRARAHRVTDNVYVYATKADKYGYFVWQFVSLFACGYALKLHALQDSDRTKEWPDSNYNRVNFHYCADFADDGADYTLVDYVRMHNACFADDAAFLALIEKEMAAGRHVSMAFVRMLEEMGGYTELISRVMEYRQQREHARQQALEVRAEQEKQEEQQRQQEHEKALAACRETILRDGECMPIDGAILCELAASLGLAVSLKLKGWIMNKLATVTIENGHMVMYQYKRYKQTEKGSNTFVDWMNRLLDALRQQEEAAEAEETSEEDLNRLFGRDNAPKLENQAQNLENEHGQPIRNDGADAWRSISSHTVCNLMNEKGVECDGNYREISNFSLAILRAGETLPAVDGETWMEFFERAFPVAFPDTARHENTTEATAAVNVDIYVFAEQFQKEYDSLYENEHVAGYREAVEAFGNACNGESFRRFVAQFAKLRGDLISSDREAAAFMFALGALAPGSEASPVEATQGGCYDFDKAYNNIPAAVEAFFSHARQLHGETLFGVRFDHVDGSGFWFSYELTHDHRRQVYCVRHADLDGDGAQHSPHFDQEPPKAGCGLPGGDGIAGPVSSDRMRDMVSDWMTEQGLTDADVVINWDGFNARDHTVPCCDSSHRYLLEAAHGGIHIVPVGAL